MSQIDTRKLIEETLPDLAMQIARKCLYPIGEGTDWRTPQQSSWRSQADYSRPFHRTVEPDGKGGYQYIYEPYRRPDAPDYRFRGRNGTLCTECRIGFYNLRVTEVLNTTYGPLDKVPAGPAVVSTKRYPNDSGEAVTKHINLTHKDWTDWSTSWELAVESEIEQTLKAGSEFYGVESETRLKISASASKSGSQGGGSETSQTDDTTTVIKPHSVLEVVTTKQPVKISQNIVVTGKLECSIDIVLMECWGESCSTFEQLLDVFRGVGAGNSRIRGWFSNPSHTIPEVVLESLTRPTVTIDIGLKDVPGDHYEQATRQRPLQPGDETLAAVDRAVDGKDRE